jgi:hypothetical protein
MTCIRSSRTRALLLSGLLALGLTAIAAGKDGPAPTPAVLGPTQSVLVFPFADETGTGGDLSAVVTGCVTRALADAPGFQAESFHANSPTARRRVDEGVLRSEEILPPYSAKSAVAIAAALDADIVLMGTVVDRKVDEQTGVVSLTLSGTTYLVRDNVDPTTGQPVPELKPDKKLGVTGTSKGRRGGGGRLGTLERSAADDAAAKVVEVLAGGKPVTAPAKKKPFLKKWGYILMGAGIVVAIISATADSGKSPAAGAPPPTNLSTGIVNPGAPGQGIQLNWAEPPLPHPTVLQYAVRRSVNGGAFQALAASPMPPTQFSVTDFDVLPNQQIEYQIRAEYTNPTKQSAWVSFGAVQVPEII